MLYELRPGASAARGGRGQAESAGCGRRIASRLDEIGDAGAPFLQNTVGKRMKRSRGQQRIQPPCPGLTGLSMKERRVSIAYWMTGLNPVTTAKDAATI